MPAGLGEESPQMPPASSIAPKATRPALIGLSSSPGRPTTSARPPKIRLPTALLLTNLATL